MKTTKPKTARKKKVVLVDDTQPATTRTERNIQRDNAAARAAAGHKLGLKEQVKAGLLPAKTAMTKLLAKGSDAKGSNTYAWLQKRAQKEGAVKKADAEANA